MKLLVSVLILCSLNVVISAPVLETKDDGIRGKSTHPIWQTNGRPYDLECIDVVVVHVGDIACSVKCIEQRHSDGHCVNGTCACLDERL